MGEIIILVENYIIALQNPLCYTESMKNKKGKTTSEKPVSLSPLNLKVALEGLLKVELKEDK